MKNKKEKDRISRHRRIRRMISGKADKPRLAIFSSHRNIFVQLIDDVKQKTLLSLSTLNKEVKEKIKFGGNIKAATFLGQILAEKAKEKGIETVCFDRGGYLYHGKVKALAESTRKAGLKF